MSATQGRRKGWGKQASQTFAGAAYKPIPTPTTSIDTAGTTIPAAATLPGRHTYAVRNVLALPVPGGLTGRVYGRTPTNATPVAEITARRCAHRAVLTQTRQSRSSNSSSPFFLKKGKLSKGQLEPWTGTIDLPQPQEMRETGQPPSRSGPTRAIKSGATLTGGMPEQLWEGGKNRPGLDTTLVDEAWRQVRPHQRTRVKFTLLGLLLAASDYDTRAMHYLVEGFREGFHLRLNRPIDQIASDRRSNKRVVKGNNKTALDNPQAVEAKLE